MCKCGRPNRPRQRNCDQCNREAQRRHYARKRAYEKRRTPSPLVLVDEAIAAGRCMWRLLAKSGACRRKAEHRDGNWFTCAEHTRSVTP